MEYILAPKPQRNGVFLKDGYKNFAKMDASLVL